MPYRTGERMYPYKWTPEIILICHTVRVYGCPYPYNAVPCVFTDVSVQMDTRLQISMPYRTGLRMYQYPCSYKCRRAAYRDLCRTVRVTESRIRIQAYPLVRFRATGRY